MRKETGTSSESEPWTAGTPENKGEPQLAKRLRYEVKESQDIVELKWEERRPSKPRHANKKTETFMPAASEDEAIVFLPGVNLEADSGPVLDAAQHYSNAAQMQAISISTRIDNPHTKDSQFVQAEAILQLVNKLGLKRITIVGNSQGANKGMDLTFLLEQAGVDVRGLIMTSPAGTYDQPGPQVTETFFRDALLNGPQDTAKAFVKNQLDSHVPAASALAVVVGKNLVTEVARSGTTFLPRLKRESKEGGSRNPRAEHIQAPVLMVFGADDAVFDEGKFIPPVAHDQSTFAQNMRTAEARKLFVESADVAVLSRKKEHMAGHGMHYFDNETVSYATWDKLMRMERNRAKAPSKVE